MVGCLASSLVSIADTVIVFVSRWHLKPNKSVPKGAERPGNQFVCGCLLCTW